MSLLVNKIFLNDEDATIGIYSYIAVGNTLDLIGRQIILDLKYEASQVVNDKLKQPRLAIVVIAVAAVMLVAATSLLKL